MQITLRTSEHRANFTHKTCIQMNKKRVDYWSPTERVHCCALPLLRSQVLFYDVVSAQILFWELKLTLLTWKCSNRRFSWISWSGLAGCATDERKPSSTPLMVNFFMITIANSLSLFICPSYNQTRKLGNFRMNEEAVFSTRRTASCLRNVTIAWPGSGGDNKDSRSSEIKRQRAN